MAVHPDYQRMGIGKLLTEQGIKICQEKGYTSIIVVGHPEYYPKFGFEPAKKWGLKCPFKVPDDVFMAVEIKVDTLKPGLIEYPEEFNDV